jgi:hypothetical protein
MKSPREAAVDRIVKPQRTAEELRIALHKCEVSKREITAAKKAATGSYNDSLKDVDKEIEGVLDQLKQLESAVLNG